MNKDFIIRRLYEELKECGKTNYFEYVLEWIPERESVRVYHESVPSNAIAYLNISYPDLTDFYYWANKVMAQG